MFREPQPNGQAALEMVLVTCLIFVLAMSVVGHFNQVKSSTTAMAILKSRALEAVAGEGEFYYIERIDPAENAEGTAITLDITTGPGDLSSFAVDISGVCDEIIGMTKYDDATVTLNSANTVCTTVVA